MDGIDVAVSADVATFVTPLAALVLGVILARFRPARGLLGGGALVVSLALLARSASAFASLNGEGRIIALSLKDVPGTPLLYLRTLDAAVPFVLALAAAALGLLLVAWAMPSPES